MAAPHPAAANPPWQRKQSRSTGAWYYWNERTNQSVWHDDALPPGWAWGRDGEGAPKWYLHLPTGRKVARLDDIPAPSPTGTTPLRPTATTATMQPQQQLSFVASQTAGEDRLSKAYIPDEATHGANIPADIASKRDYLFAGVPEHLRWRLQVDEVSLFSATQHRLAVEQARLISELVGGTATVTDATASVGGNTLVFGTVFSHVHAVELSAQRASMLRHNVELLGQLGVVHVHQGDYVSLYMRTLKQDVVFMDPPWGGPEYKTATSLDMFLGGVNVSHVIVYLTTATTGLPPPARYVALKAPTNYNVSGLSAALSAAGSGARILHTVPQHRMMFLIIQAGDKPGHSGMGMGASATTSLPALPTSARDAGDGEDDGRVVAVPAGSASAKAADFEDFVRLTLRPHVAALRRSLAAVEAEADEWREQAAAFRQAAHAAAGGADGGGERGRLDLLVDVGGGYLMRGRVEVAATPLQVQLDIGAGVMPMLFVEEAMAICERRRAAAERRAAAVREELVKALTDAAIASAVVE